MSTTILIVTLGARDIQLKEELEEIGLYCKEGRWLLKDNRLGVKYLLENFDKTKKVIEYPIVKPAIDCAINKFKAIDKLIFVTTDQSRNEGVDKTFLNHDSIEISKLLEKLIRSDYNSSRLKQIKKLVVTEGVIYYDTMYDFFDEQFKTTLQFENDANIMLYAQSGIDAINTTLLLKCIEIYPQTIQLNKPEKNNTAFELSFPKKFLKSLATQKILHNLNNYNYAAISGVSENERITELSKYAYTRISLDIEQAAKHLSRLLTIDPPNRSFYQEQMNQLNELESDFFKKQQDIYLAVKIKLHQKAYAEFLILLFALAENLLKPKAEEHTKTKFWFNKKNNHKEWLDMLNNNQDLKNYLINSKYNGKKLNISEPTRAAYKAIIDFYNKDEEPDKVLDKMYSCIEKLAELRNKVVHNLEKVNEHDIQQILKFVGSSLDDFINTADGYFKIGTMGQYSKINEKIISMF